MIYTLIVISFLLSTIIFLKVNFLIDIINLRKSYLLVFDLIKKQADPQKIVNENIFQFKLILKLFFKIILCLSPFFLVLFIGKKYQFYNEILDMFFNPYLIGFIFLVVVLSLLNNKNKNGSNYSMFSKVIHRLYLGNIFLAEGSYELEKIIFWPQVKNFIFKDIVLITGLARAGTTNLFNKIHETQEFASLTYSNMPILLMPNFWKKFDNSANSQKVKRAHNDGLEISTQSPEAFDEFFWKVKLKNCYITEANLKIHSLNEDEIDEYLKYIKLVCFSFEKKRYLSKNNNSILRLKSLLEKIDNLKVILVFRDPLSHAYSLYNQHQHFLKLQKNDSFAIEYLNFLGHHEFGNGLKSFQIKIENVKYANPDSINYWLQVWESYYKYIIENFGDKVHVISFFDICNNPEVVNGYLQKLINSNTPIILDKYTPNSIPDLKVDEVLLDSCNLIYVKLESMRSYNK